MSKLVHIPESALAALLREAGHAESVETYLSSMEIQTAVQAGSRLIQRARAAYWSRFWLAFSALATWLGLFMSPDLEGFVSALLLTGMTVLEFKVYTLFQMADMRGAIYGWWNQCLFAVLFLIYGGYHGTFASIPLEVQGMVDTESLSMVTALERLFYYTIAVVGAAGQFWLACYYRGASTIPHGRE